jgi:hypothetical protein
MMKMPKQLNQEEKIKKPPRVRVQFAFCSFLFFLLLVDVVLVQCWLVCMKKSRFRLISFFFFFNSLVGENPIPFSPPLSSSVRPLRATAKEVVLATVASSARAEARLVAAAAPPRWSRQGRREGGAEHVKEDDPLAAAVDEKVILAPHEAFLVKGVARGVRIVAVQLGLLEADLWDRLVLAFVK